MKSVKRRLFWWRFIALASFMGALGIWSVHSHPKSFDYKRPHIARLVIKGEIRSDVSKFIKALKKAQDDTSVTGLLLVVDSPGGEVTGGVRLHNAIENFAHVKPVAVTMGSLGASAAYMLSAPANHIVALPSTLTGSIGVILQRPDLSALLNSVGVNMAAITSGKMKDQTDFTTHLTPEGHAMLQGLVNDLFDQFVEMVARGRHMSESQVRSLADGRAYTGRQALSLGLIDELGDEDQARLWLKNKLKITQDDYPFVDLEIKKKSYWNNFVFSKSFLGIILGEDIWDGVERSLLQNSLDGAVSILQF
ncbi:signal peptide peptidase SppA [Swingsia samuiensis]|nr:signal peptide peptidase SppA [Swingsia samuiensis]